MRPLLLAMVPLALALGCGGPFSCTAEEKKGIVLTVIDGATGASRCDARVTITDGAYRETPTPQQGVAADGGPQCTYAGAAERAGAYTVEASAEDMNSIIDVMVTRDACHVHTQAFTIVL